MYRIRTMTVPVLAFVALTSAAFAADSAEQVFFTSDRASSSQHHQTQLFVMNADGTHVRQLTRSQSTKAYPYHCAVNGPVFFQSGDALARLNAREIEEIYLAAKGVQYHSPRCSSDARYLSVTAWDKKRKKPYIEVYRLAGKQRVARWAGEQASWMRNSHRLIYRQVVNHGKRARIDLMTRALDGHGAPKKLYSHDLAGEVYDISDPQFIDTDLRHFVFRVYDEHEYFYYLGKIGNDFVLTRNKKPLAHHNLYSGDVGEPLEQDELTLAPDGKYAVFTEHPWNTPPSLYLVNLHTRNSWKIAEGFHPVWSEDSGRIYFNKDPQFYARYHEAKKAGRDFMKIYPRGLAGYEIYSYDLARKEEKRLTRNSIYDGFL